MKHFQSILVIMVFSFLNISTLKAQAPQGFPYQAVARSNAGNLLAGQSISIRISVLDLSSSGTVLYRETHSVTTNSLGLFTINVGQGTVTLGTFAGIAWGSGAKYIKVDMDANGGSSYTTMGTSQLLSVPYALYANVPGVAGPQGTAGVDGKTVLNGTTNPTAGTGVNGDFYINTTSDQIYGPKTGGVWGTGTSLIGPQGIQGIQGAAGTNGTNGTNGANGVDGKTILNGTSNPAAGTGVNGDFYINTTNDQIFGPKTGGVWGTGTSLIGPQGIQGIQGAAGANGTNGTNGANGVDGKTILNGTSNPTAGTGVNGDFYINTTNDQIFGPKTGGVWGTGTSLIGPQGSQGIQGIQGIQGATGAAGTNGTNGTNGINGKTILNGTTNPNVLSGVDGDFYINTTSNQLFGPKAGIWGSGTSLVGPTGPSGISLTNVLNGLTKVSDTIKTGGRLTETTTIAQDGFSFQLKDNDGTSNVLDISQTSFSPTTNLSVTASTQTFTALNTAKIASIKLRVTAINGSVITLGLKNSNNQVLAVTTVTYNASFDNWQTFVLSNHVVQTAGEVYTLSVTGNAGTTWYYSSSNVYAGGQSSVNAARDFAFETFVFSEAPVLFVNNQKVGIGNTNPASKLDVSGKTRTSLFQLTTGASNGALLVSDANGNGDWTDISALDVGTLDEAYNFGGVGAGRTIHANGGAVRIQGEDGLLVTGTLGIGDTVDVSGTGTRMFFNPKKAAFRAGYVTTDDWDESNIGMYSVGLGLSSEASGQNSVSIGNYCLASASNSYALGSNAKATGGSTLSIGIGSEAIGNNSSAFGYSTSAYGSFSNAYGYQSNAYGAHSNAFGFECETNGYNSTTFGNKVQSNGYAGFVIGRWNDTIVAPETSSMQISTPLFIIGNGSAANTRSNAFVVRNDGKVGIGNNATLYQLELSTNSAAKPSSSSWTISSDARLKSIDGDYTKGLNEILKLNTIQYHYKQGNARNLPSDEQSYGFIAQEVQKVFPECVKENADGYLSLDMHPILVSYINGFKELNQMNDTLHTQVEVLTAGYDALKNQYELLLKRLEVLEKR